MKKNKSKKVLISKRKYVKLMADHKLLKALKKSGVDRLNIYNKALIILKDRYMET